MKDLDSRWRGPKRTTCRSMGRSRTRPESIPAVGDPYWVSFCRPLMRFLLVEDRKWEDVHAWAKGEKINGYFLRNALAWLEEKGYVETYLPTDTKTKAGAWIWRVTDVRAATVYVKEKKDEENLPSEARRV